MALGLPVGVSHKLPHLGRSCQQGETQPPTCFCLSSFPPITVPDGARRGRGPNVLARGHMLPVADLETFGSLPPWKLWLVEGRPFSLEDGWAVPSPLGYGPPSSPEPAFQHQLLENSTL